MLSRKILVATGFFVFITIGIAATIPPEDDESFKNLRVLSKHTTEDEMDRIMYHFEKGLGVSCMYCHVSAKDTSVLKMDFASDEKKEKIVARNMLKMTMALNKKYFNTKIDNKISVQPVIWCKTCHRGFPQPPLRSF